MLLHQTISGHIVSVILLYKVFALLHRIEPVLDQHQPEEQHGFRAGRRMEEHLLSANLFSGKTKMISVPVWIVSLDLSKQQNVCGKP